jgi:hypothetical protein
MIQQTTTLFSGEIEMAKKAQESGVSRSQAVRDVLKANPEIKFSEAVSTLAGKGIKVSKATFYLVKGSLAGQKTRRKKNRKKAVQLITASSNGSAVVKTPATAKSDALATIHKIKLVAGEVGGLLRLKALVDVLSE